jgi:hypothetical protein
MRIIEGDKLLIDNTFLTYGLQSDVELEIYELNNDGQTYDILATFAIDFESYEIQDYFSEFALKSVSVIDFYNGIKNTEIQIDLSDKELISLPNTQKLTNYISLKKQSSTRNSTENAYIFSFAPNNESKFFDKDTALESTTFPVIGEVLNSKILTFGQNESAILNFSYSGVIEFDVIFGNTTTFEIAIYKNASLTNKVLSLKTGTASYSAVSDNRIFEIPNTKISLGNVSYITGDDLFVAVKFGDITAVNSINSTLFLDIKKATSINAVSDNDKIRAINADDLLNIIFNNNVASSLSGVKITSARSLMGVDNSLTIKPSEFLRDFCIANGVMINFALGGGVFLNLIGTYFDNLLSDSNAIEITDFKDFSMSYAVDLNFASVSVGQEIKEYDIYTYLMDWNKALTFKQQGRAASENIELVLQKYRTDFSGVLDYFYKKSQQSNSAAKDNFIFKEYFCVNYLNNEY